MSGVAVLPEDQLGKLVFCKLTHAVERIQSLAVVERGPRFLAIDWRPVSAPGGQLQFLAMQDAPTGPPASPKQARKGETLARRALQSCVNHNHIKIIMHIPSPIIFY